MGVAGPVIGSVYGILPQSRIFKAVKALSKGNLTAQRILGSGVGGATGKLTEEAADYIQGFQLQDAQDLKEWQRKITLPDTTFNVDSNYWIKGSIFNIGFNTLIKYKFISLISCQGLNIFRWFLSIPS